MDLEEVWRIREEEIYPAIFGGACRGIFVLESELFKNRFGAPEFDPRWMTYGVFEFAPTSSRPFWIYVTSAHSNPWDQKPEDYDPELGSGSGAEFLFASSVQGDWAIRFLQNMLAFDLLLGVGHFGDRPTLDVGHRVPLNSPINGDERSLVRNAIISQPDVLPTEFILPSGGVSLLTFTGATDAEITFAKAEGTDSLVQRLQAAGCYPVTDPRRNSVL